ncbi:hypothetical protein [Streptomyces sp. NRRL F-5123]|uniref:hypothetical protein n=1 Tax=Streptomyces sp. NRRL F-5123 TaxID=1463856 RepID=UPI0004E0CD2F|nr:hypothetical protein [Streptomyces sp. NRRL F-5123]
MSDETPRPAQPEAPAVPEPEAAPAAEVTPEPAPEPAAEPAPELAAEVAPAPEPAAEVTPEPAPAPDTGTGAAPEGVLPVQPAAFAAPVPPPPSAYGYPGGQPYAYPAWETPVPPAPPRRKRRTALLVAGALVVVAAAGGGYALTRDGDGGGRPGTPVAEPSATATPTPSSTYAVTAGGTHVGDLGQMLLPMPESMRPGPDVEQFGNDSVLDASRAKTLLMGGDSGSSLFTSAQRRQLEADIDAMHVKGAALRTYRTADNKQTYQLFLVQVGNKTAANAGPEAYRSLTKGSKYLEMGPDVPGYPHAVCVRPSDNSDDDYSDDDYSDDYDNYDYPSVDTMFCEATEGDLMVQFQAVGTALDEDDISSLLRLQLDRVKAPEEGI